MAARENVIPVNPTLEAKFGLSYLIRSTGPTLWMAGILSADEESFALVGANDMEAQIRQIYRRMRNVLAKANADLTHVVSEISFTTDMKALAQASWVRDEIYRNAGAAPPVGTAVEVKGLYLPGALLEIHATAEMPSP